MLTGTRVTTPLLLLSSYNNSVQKEPERGGRWGGIRERPGLSLPSL